MSFGIPHLQEFAPSDALLLRLLHLDDLDIDAPAASAATWEALLPRATDLAVSPLVYAAIRPYADRLGVPPAVYQTLHNHYAENGLRNLALYQRLRTVVQGLQRRGFAIIVLKGAYLAQGVYRDPSLRLMSDIDLLVKPEDVARLRDLFHELGYAPVPSAEPVGDAPHHDQFAHPTSPPDFELHWSLVSAGQLFQVDHQGLWERAVKTSIAGLPVQVLSPEDMVLHLCLHTSYQHVFDRFSLRCLCDIQRCLRHYGDNVDWDQVCRRAAEWRCTRNVHLTLLLAGELLGAAVPPTALADLRPAEFDDRLARWATHRVLGLVDDREGPWSANVGRWHLTTSLTERTRLAQRICFPPRQEMADRSGLPPDSNRLWLVYFQHWGDLVSRLIRMVLPAKCDHTAVHPVQWTERETGRAALMRWLRYKNKRNGSS